MTVRINKQKINLREKLAETEEKVSFDEVVRGLGEYSSNVGIGNMTILSDGNVGIGTDSPAYPLHVWSDTELVRLGGTDTNDTFLNILKEDASSIIKVQASKSGTGAANIAINPDGGNVGIGTTSPGTYKLKVNGDVFASSYTPTSDDRVKHNEQPIVGALETLSKVTPKKYIKTTEMYDADHDFELDGDGNPIDDNGEPVEHRIEAGVIAQQVLSVDELAFAVSPESVDEDGVATSPHGLDYNSLFTYAIAAIQEQQTIIDQLKSQNESLAGRISALES